MSGLDISKLRFVLFDWDNTLAESRSSLVAAIDRVLAGRGLPPWKISKEKRDRNLSFKDNFPRIFGADADTAYEEYRQIYKSIVPKKLTAFPGAKDVLEFFARRGIKMMIVTNKERCLLEYELPLLYDRNRFCNIVCGHEAPADKPSGQQIVYTLKDYLSPEEISPQNTWMIGDSPQDSTAALDAGALPVRVHRSIWDDEAPSAGNIMYFSDFKALLNALRLAKN